MAPGTTLAYASGGTIVVLTDADLVRAGSLEELKEMALAMTTYNADGSIDVLGFNPLMGYYENTPTNWAMTVSAN